MRPPNSTSLSACALLAALALPGVALAGVVGEWTFDGASTDSVGTNDASTFGATSYVPGIAGQALRMDWQGGGATMDSIVADMGAGDFSISMWVKYEGHFTGHVRHEHPFTSGWGDTGPAASRSIDLFAERNGGNTFFWANGNGTQIANGQTAPWISAQNTWHHVVMGRDASTQYLCLDGSVFASGPVGSAYDHTGGSPSYVGRNPVDNGGRSFPGAIDELQVYDEWVGTAGCASLFASPGSTVGAAAPAVGTTWDGVAEFSSTDNPNGPWSFGRSPTAGGAITLNDAGTQSGLPIWSWAGAGWGQAIYNNTTGTVGLSGGLAIEPGELFLHPSSNNTKSVMSFAAPSAGCFQANTNLELVDVQGGNVDVSLFGGGTSLFSTNMSGFGATSANAVDSVFLDAGDAISLYIGFGTNGNYFDDSVGTQFTATYVGAGVDTTGDGNADSCAPDSDGDGVIDDVDACPSEDATWTVTAAWTPSRPRPPTRSSTPSAPRRPAATAGPARWAASSSWARLRSPSTASATKTLGSTAWSPVTRWGSGMRTARCSLRPRCPRVPAARSSTTGATWTSARWSSTPAAPTTWAPRSTPTRVTPGATAWIR